MTSMEAGIQPTCPLFTFLALLLHHPQLYSTGPCAPPSFAWCLAGRLGLLPVAALASQLPEGGAPHLGGAWGLSISCNGLQLNLLLLGLLHCWLLYHLLLLFWAGSPGRSAGGKTEGCYCSEGDSEEGMCPVVCWGLVGAHFSGLFLLPSPRTHGMSCPITNATGPAQMQVPTTVSGIQLASPSFSAAPVPIYTGQLWASFRTGSWRALPSTQRVYGL